MKAAERWSRALADWAIPPEILAGAPESPWGFPTELYAQRADTPPQLPTISTQRALEALLPTGSVLDVGCGAGAASLPLAPATRRYIGVDASTAMLEAFRSRAEAVDKPVTPIEGLWPAVADRTPSADVVVCHHVVYNVPEIAAFAAALTAHARRRVVLELPRQHPMSDLNDLWRHFHGRDRPTGPTADDAVAVLRELGLEPGRTEWLAPARTWSGTTARQDLVAWARRRLCLSAERDAEIDEALSPELREEHDGVRLASRPVVTLWWPGTAP